MLLNQLLIQDTSGVRVGSPGITLCVKRPESCSGGRSGLAAQTTGPIERLDGLIGWPPLEEYRDADKDEDGCHDEGGHTEDLSPPRIKWVKPNPGRPCDQPGYDPTHDESTPVPSPGASLGYGSTEDRRLDVDNRGEILGCARQVRVSAGPFVEVDAHPDLVVEAVVAA